MKRTAKTLSMKVAEGPLGGDDWYSSGGLDQPNTAQNFSGSGCET